MFKGIAVLARQRRGVIILFMIKYIGSSGMERLAHVRCDIRLSVISYVLLCSALFSLLTQMKVNI